MLEWRRSCFALLKLALTSLGISSGCSPQKFIGLEVRWWGRVRVSMLGEDIPVKVEPELYPNELISDRGR
jgi:hypothetical protein